MRLRAGKEFYFLFLIMFAGLVGVSSIQGTFQFLGDKSLDAPISVPYSLGHYPHHCVGSIGLCTSGFTFSIWLNPAEGNLSPDHLYYFSSGGHLPYSEGFYIRQNFGKEFEAGVAKNGTLWQVLFYLKPGVTANVLLRWRDGLQVFVDGIQAGVDNVGSGRLYVDQLVDPFPELVIGAEREYVNINGTTDVTDTLTVGNITFWNEAKSDEDIAYLSDPSGTRTYLGCTTSIPGEYDALQSQDVLDCRKTCVSMNLSIVYIREGEICFCYSEAEHQSHIGMTGPLSDSCEEDNYWEVYWSSRQQWNIIHDIRLQVDMELPEKGYTRSNETVSFILSTQADEDVVFLIDFCDGKVKTTRAEKIGYAWESEGTYNVNITAVTRSSRETRFIEVTIEWVDEGVAPELVVLKSDCQEESKQIRSYLIAAGIEPKLCEVDFGDGTTLQFKMEDKVIFDHYEVHLFQDIGFYNVFFECRNDYGSSHDTEIALAVHPIVEHEYRAKDGVIMVPVLGANRSTSNLLVFVNDAEVATTITGYNVTINQAVASYSGEHVVQLKGNGKTMYTKIFDLQNPVDDIEIKTNGIHTTVNTQIELTFRIGQGDFLHIHISYGDRTDEFLYIPYSEGPVVMARNHSYAELGVYEVKITVSNDVSWQMMRQLVSIERPIERAKLSAINTTEIGQPTMFMLDVDLHLSPAMPVQVEFIYNDGNTESVTLGMKSQELMTLSHEYTYNTYGIYYVHARVGNNISMADVSTVLQVGQNITFVDVYSDADRVMVGENITFKVHCPTGAPIKLEIETGDGDILVVHRPERVYQYVDGVIPNTTTSAPTSSTTSPFGEDGSGSIDEDINSDDMTLSRRKREAEDTEGDSSEDLDYIGFVYDVPAEAVAVNEDFFVTYQYAHSGQHHVKVKVSNKFGYAETHLCPDIMVLSEGIEQPTCGQFEITIKNISSETEPLVAMRSSEVVLETTVVNDCVVGDGFLLETRLTWTVEWQTEHGEWRPELEVCGTEQRSSKLIVNPNTLWYGTYRLQSTATLHLIPDMNARKKREIGDVRPTLLGTKSEYTYLEIIPSPLVAKIQDEEETSDVTFWGMANVNMTPSFDPDVNFGNQSGMEFFLFCYLKSSTEQMQAMSLGELLDNSTKITNNSMKTAHLYEYNFGSCFVDETNIWLANTELVFPGDAATTNDSLIFDLIVKKDERMARTSAEIRIWSTNITTDNALDAIDALLASGDTSAALLVIDMATDALNVDDEGGNNTDAKAARSEMRGKLINVLGNVADLVANYDQLDKTASALYKVTAVTDEVSEDGKANAAGALGSAADKADSLATNANLDQVSGMAETMVGAAGNVLPFADDADDISNADSTSLTTASYMDFTGVDNTDSTTTVVILSTTTLTSLLQPTVPPSIAPEPEEVEVPCCERENGLCAWVEPMCSVVEEDDRKAGEWDNVMCDSVHPDDLLIIRQRYETWKLAKKLDKYAKKKDTTVGGWAACNKIADVVNSKQDDAGSEVNINTEKMKMKVAKVDSTTGNSLGAFNVPSEVTGSLEGGAGATVMETPNPFTYDDSASSVKGKVMTMSFKNPDGTSMQVANLTDPIDIWMQGKPELVPPASKHFFLTSAKSRDKMNYHSITVPSNDTGLHVIIRPDSVHDVYYVYLKYMDFPNSSYFDWRTEVPNSNMYNTSDAWKLDQLRYTIFPPQDMTRYNGTYRIGILLKETKLTLDQLTAENNFTYTFRVFISSCKFWNEENDTWSADGCKVGPLTTIKETQCQCNHLTSFGSDFVVPPNTIDFNNVFTPEKFLESMPVFCTVIAVIMLYIGVMIWARRQDKKDLIKWGATPLEDNLPSDTYHYQMTVHTGVKKKSGTTSRVSFILSGDEADSGVRRLYDGKRKELPTSSIYNFILSVENCLGPLTYLRIWHDNSGKGKNKGWFLDQVQITDLQTGDKYFFLNNRWLAVEEDDGMVDRIIPVAGLADLTAFKHLFSSSVRKKLTNDHMWVSVLSRPTKSNFTRVQRVSCCVSLLFLTMITNCMFFKSDEKQENVQALSVGPFQFTLHQVFISIVTTTIVFPPSLAIVTIFRKARPKRNNVMHINQSLSKKSRKFRWRKFTPGSALWNNVEQTRFEKFKDSVRNILSFHQRSKYETELPEGGKKGKKKKKSFSLPHWTMYIAWILVFLCVVVSGFFTILYSMEWGKEKSLEWLSTFLLSFFQSVIVVQPIKVLLLAAFISCIMRKPDIDDEEETFDDANAHQQSNQIDLTSSQRDLQELIKQRQLKAADLPPPDMESLEKAREHRMKEIAMEAILKECIVYFLFILVLFFLSYQVRDANSYQFANNIKNHFWTKQYGLISKPDTFWDWMHGSFLPSYYSDAWYNGKSLNWREALQIDDRNTIRVGVARLRQLRIKDDSCKIQPHFQTIINHCRNDYTWTDDDTKDYLPTWILPDGDEETGVIAFGDRYCGLLGESQAGLKGDKNSPWIYRNSLELKNAPYSGKLRTYKGGGYTFTFRRTKAKTEKLMTILERQEWVDTRTRAVFTEFTLYNANINLFASVIMGVEWMATGSAVSKAEVKVFRMSSYVGGFGILVIIFELIYLGFTLYFIIRLIKMLRKEKLGYFKDFWNLLEFSTLVLSIITIVMYGIKKLSGTVAINALKESGSGEYVNFVTISIWDEIFGFIMALVVFVSTLKFIKMLKFNRRMGMMGDTIKLATKDLKSFCVIFFVYFFAFAQAGYMLFGKKLENYGSFIGTVEALFAFALGDFDFYDLQDTQKFLGPIFFFLYVGIVSIGLMGMFLTIIYDSFARVKSDTELQSNDYEIVDFILKKFKGIFGWS